MSALSRELTETKDWNIYFCVSVDCCLCDNLFFWVRDGADEVTRAILAMRKMMVKVTSILTKTATTTSKIEKSSARAQREHATSDSQHDAARYTHVLFARLSFFTAASTTFAIANPHTRQSPTP